MAWSSQESPEVSLGVFQFNQFSLEDGDDGLSSGSSLVIVSGRSQHKCERLHSQLPIGWRLLHEAKKISRYLSLALALAGMVIIGFVCLGQPWVHFQVPLMPAGAPGGARAIHIDTIFFVQCRDASCLHEYDQNAYLLDFSWAFLVITSITSVCLCFILVNIIFFTSSSSPVLDFSSIITSTLTGLSMILGILFYLMQTREFLQEGMAYKLGSSFYMAWTGVFLFLMTGFFPYLNYMNFWSILSL